MTLPVPPPSLDSDGHGPGCSSRGPATANHDALGVPVYRDDASGLNIVTIRRHHGPTWSQMVTVQVRVTVVMPAVRVRVLPRRRGPDAPGPDLAWP